MSTEDSRGSRASPCDTGMVDACPYARVHTQGTQAPGVPPDMGGEDASWQVHGWEQMSPLGQDTVSREARPVWGWWGPRLLPSTVLDPETAPQIKSR